MQWALIVGSSLLAWLTVVLMRRPRASPLQKLTHPCAVCGVSATPQGCPSCAMALTEMICHYRGIPRP